MQEVLVVLEAEAEAAEMLEELVQQMLLMAVMAQQEVMGAVEGVAAKAL